MKKVLVLLVGVLASTSIFAQLDGRINGVYLENGKNIVCPHQNFCFLVEMQKNQITNVIKKHIIFQKTDKEETIDVVREKTPELNTNEAISLMLTTSSINSQESVSDSNTAAVLIKLEEEVQLWKYQNLGIILRVGKDENGNSVLVYKLLRI